VSFAPAPNRDALIDNDTGLISQPWLEWFRYMNSNGEDASAGIIDLEDTKLNRAGDQPMEGNLQMDDGLGPWRIYDILDLYLIGGVGSAEITGARVIQMTGADTDNEGLITQIERIKFNATTSEAVIEDPGRIEFQAGVTPGTDYTVAEGITSWSDVEGTLVVSVVSGA
jgi:hypothetical protein